MKILAWNVCRAGPRRPALWELIERENADIVLLQEVTRIPARILDIYQAHLLSPKFFEGECAKFSTAVLARGPIDATPFLESGPPWVNRINSRCRGWIVDCRTSTEAGERLRVVSVHLPAFPIPKARWANVDASGIRLTNNPDLWFTEILWSLLAGTGISKDENWVVGGDFNSSVLFDNPHDRGNREVIARLNSLGLVDCLSHFQGNSVPTFQDTRKGVNHQLDYCYVNGPMLDRLVDARVPDRAAVFSGAPRLSDHLPVICEFEQAPD